MRFTALLALFVCAGLPAQMTFDRVELRTDYGQAEGGNDGKLVVTHDRIRFMKNIKKDIEYFSLPTAAIDEIFYSRVSGRRIGAAILVTPLLLFSKGRKHYMTLTFDDGAQLVGAIEFKLHKDNYRGTLRAIEQVTNLTMLYDQEGIKDEKQTVASQGPPPAGEAVTGLSIATQPSGAEIEIDGAYVGVTPRTQALAPGEYKLKLTKKGFRNWERKVMVTAGEVFELAPELEAK